MADLDPEDQKTVEELTVQIQNLTWQIAHRMDISFRINSSLDVNPSPERGIELINFYHAYCQPCLVHIFSKPCANDPPSLYADHLETRKHRALIAKYPKNTLIFDKNQPNWCLVCSEIVTPRQFQEQSIYDAIAKHAFSAEHRDRAYIFFDPEMSLLTAISHSNPFLTFIAGQNCSLCFVYVDTTFGPEEHISSFSHLMTLVKYLKTCFGLDVGELMNKEAVTYLMVEMHKWNKSRLTGVAIDFQPYVRKESKFEDVPEVLLEQKEYEVNETVLANGTEEAFNGQLTDVIGILENMLTNVRAANSDKAVEDTVKPQKKAISSKKLEENKTATKTLPSVKDTLFDRQETPPSKEIAEKQLQNQSTKPADISLSTENLNGEVQIKKKRRRRKKTAEPTENTVQSLENPQVTPQSKEIGAKQFEPGSSGINQPKMTSDLVSKSNNDTVLSSTEAKPTSSKEGAFDDQFVPLSNQPKKKADPVAKASKAAGNNSMQAMPEPVKDIATTPLQHSPKKEAHSIHFSTNQLATKDEIPSAAEQAEIPITDDKTWEDQKKQRDIFLKNIQENTWQKLHEPHPSTVQSVMNQSEVKFIWKDVRKFLKSQENPCPIDFGETRQCVEIFNFYHAYCKACRFHIYSRTDDNDFASFFSSHINTVRHRATTLLLPSDEPMFTTTSLDSGRCNACLIDLTALKFPEKSLRSEIITHLQWSYHEESAENYFKNSLLIALATNQHFQTLSQHVSNKYAHCTICLKNYAKFEELDHLESQEHLQKLSGYLGQNCLDETDIMDEIVIKISLSDLERQTPINPRLIELLPQIRLFLLKRPMRESTQQISTRTNAEGQESQGNEGISNVSPGINFSGATALGATTGGGQNQLTSNTGTLAHSQNQLKNYPTKKTKKTEELPNEAGAASTSKITSTSTEYGRYQMHPRMNTYRRQGKAERELQKLFDSKPITIINFAHAYCSYCDYHIYHFNPMEIESYYETHINSKSHKMNLESEKHTGPLMRKISKNMALCFCCHEIVQRIDKGGDLFSLRESITIHLERHVFRKPLS